MVLLNFDNFYSLIGTEQVLQLQIRVELGAMAMSTLLVWSLTILIIYLGIEQNDSPSYGLNNTTTDQLQECFGIK